MLRAQLTGTDRRTVYNVKLSRIVGLAKKIVDRMQEREQNHPSHLKLAAINAEGDTSSTKIPSHH